MTKKYFGTDGIRGAINSKHINGDMFFKFGLASGKYFKSQKKRKQIAVIAKDTRLSGYTLEPALVSGLTSAGMHVFTLGPLPTNGLAMLTKSMKANMGIMITASHNTYEYNGIKFFNIDGFKISSKLEKEVENIVLNKKKYSKILNTTSISGKAVRLEDASGRYSEFLKSTLNKKIKTKNTHGTGCTLSSAITTFLSCGKPIKKSCELGIKYVNSGIKTNPKYGKGHGPINHLNSINIERTFK